MLNLIKRKPGTAIFVLIVEIFLIVNCFTVFQNLSVPICTSNELSNSNNSLTTFNSSIILTYKKNTHDKNISISTNDALKNYDYEIKNNTNTVYKGTASVDGNSNLIIPVEDLKEGYYEITIILTDTNPLSIYISNEKNESLDLSYKSMDSHYSIESKIISSFTQNKALKLVPLLLFLTFNIILFILKKYSLKPEKFFLIFSGIFGLFFIIVLPPFQAPDELNHYLRSIEISNGSLISLSTENDRGNFYSSDFMKTYANNFIDLSLDSNAKLLTSEFSNAFNSDISDNPKEFASTFNTSAYPPIYYIPEAIIALIGNFLSINPYIIFYLMRIVNLAIWMSILYLAIKIMPKYKEIISIIMLTPISLQQAISVGTDTLLNSITIFFICYMFYIYYNKKDISVKSLTILSVCLIFMTTGKVVFFALILLIFMLRHRSFKENLKTFFILLFIAVGSYILWSFINGELFVPVENVDTKQQIIYVLKNPLKYLSTLNNTIFTYSYDYVIGSIGILGWLNTPLPFYITLGFIALILICSIRSKSNDYKNDHYLPIILVITFIVTSVLVLSALYAWWTPVCFNIIQGVQGRYFITLLPLIFIPISIYNKNNKDYSNTNILITLNLLLVLSTLFVFARYFVA